MKYLSVQDTAKKWHLSERSVRNYCAEGRVPGALLKGKVWQIPENAAKPSRLNKTSPKNLLEILKAEKDARLSGGIYHKVQVELTYNSNHMEGSRLTHEQTRFIFETNTIGLEGETLKVDDIVETANHFHCIDLIIDKASQPLREGLIKKLHAMLKAGTSDARLDYFVVGEYKHLPNEVGGKATTSPEEVPERIKELLAAYGKKKEKSLEDLLDFHYHFERIHPFQDGNGRLGRLLLFKECLRYNIVPFIITDDLKMFYYRGLSQWEKEPGFLRDTCLTAQDRFKKYLDYFKIPYENI